MNLNGTEENIQKRIKDDADRAIKQNEMTTNSIANSIKKTMKKIQRMLVITDASKEKHKLEEMLSNIGNINNINNSNYNNKVNKSQNNISGKDDSIRDEGNWKIVKNKLISSTPFLNLFESKGKKVEND